jgi:glycosyltransferase involved in cell wall biosynthesis
MSPTENLLITRNFNNRGGQVVLTDIARQLEQEGVPINLVGFKPAGSENYPNCEPLYAGLNTTIVEVPPRGDDDNPFQVKGYIDAATTFLQEKGDDYDKIILDSWYIALAGITARLDQRRTFQLVQSIPHFEPQYSTEVYQSQLLGALPHFPLPRILVSRHDQTVFEQRYGQIHPKIDLYVGDTFRDAQFEVKDSPVIRFVSSAADFTFPTKGLDFLLESLEQVKGRPFSLTLVSGKPIPQELLDKYTFPIDVKFAPTPEDMAQILSQHDVYVKTSLREDFCLALAEAVALGMPAVALDSGGNRDYARGDNFVFVEDRRDFVPHLEEVMSLERRRELSPAAKESMRAYTVSNMVRQFRNITGM